MLKSTLKTTTVSALMTELSLVKGIKVAKSDNDETPPPGIWYPPDIYEGRAYYYISCNDENKKITHGELWSVTISEPKWKKIAGSCIEHAVGGKNYLLLLFLHEEVKVRSKKCLPDRKRGYLIPINLKE
uniref:Uncharacterized protein n=1 Tax=Plectus sambesii TaxID=2011161 RepID=A0A914XC28_9BILA